MLRAEFRHQIEGRMHSLLEILDRQALVDAVDARPFLAIEHDWNEAISGHSLHPDKSRVRSARGHRRDNWRSGKIARDDIAYRLPRLACGWRSRRFVRLLD